MSSFDKNWQWGIVFNFDFPAYPILVMNLSKQHHFSANP
jgi:hypothetical protein